MSTARLCVILLNYANWRDTLECLESLARTSFTDLSVIVVDTGAPDDSVDRLCAWVGSDMDARPDSDVWRRLPAGAVQRPPAFEIVKRGDSSVLAHGLPRLAHGLTILPAGRRLGFAAGCNAGLRLALDDPRIRYLWLLNNDTVVAPDAPRRLVALAASIGEPLGALGALIADYREPGRIQMLGGGNIARFSAEPLFPANGQPIEQASAYSSAVSDLDYISGASLFTTRDTVREVGLLDETMHLYWEDTDWCARMRAAGRSLVVCDEAVVWHKGHAATGGINRHTKYHSFRSAAVFMRRHRRAWLAPLLMRLGKSVARDVITARPLEAAAAVRGLSAGLRLARPGPPRLQGDPPPEGPSADA